MNADRLPVSGADEVRQVLARTDQALAVSEILGSCRIYGSTTQIACSLAIDMRAGYVERHGMRGSFLYTLTADGKAVVERPNLVHGRARRRTHGRRIDVGVLAEGVHHGR